MKKTNVNGSGTAEMAAAIRDLIVNLHRGNSAPAEVLVTDVADQLRTIMQSGMDPQSFPMQRAQQTMFAIDEVRMLMSQKDVNGALDAARDAGKEWNSQPK